MSSDVDIAEELERLRVDFANIDEESRSFEHFYCPILFRDEETELCKGHIVNESIRDSCRAWVVQRKDVDNFYGALVESKFTALVNSDGITVEKVLANARLRKVIQPSFIVDGEKVSYYEAGAHTASIHPTIAFMQGGTEFAKIALKISEDRLPDSAKLQIEINHDFIPHTVASLIKAAHLTMFKTFGYQYVFSAAGQDAAEILRSFYDDHKDTASDEKQSAMRRYFYQFAGRVIPLGGFTPDLVRGSIEDRRFLVCRGSSGTFFALGVLIRTAKQMSVVFLAPDNATSMDTYINFVSNMSKPRFHYHLAEFVSDTPQEPAHWKAFANDFEFDPESTSTIDAE